MSPLATGAEPVPTAGESDLWITSLDPSGTSSTSEDEMGWEATNGTAMVAPPRAILEESFPRALDRTVCAIGAVFTALTTYVKVVLVLTHSDMEKIEMVPTCT